MSASDTAVVLVIEDDEPVRLAACELLAAHGYRVLEAASADEGIEILAL